MAPTQNVNRIDHLADLVSTSSFESCLERLTSVLQRISLRAERKDLGLLIANPLGRRTPDPRPDRSHSPLWDRLQSHGEGHIMIIYGVRSPCRRLAGSGKRRDSGSARKSG